MNSEMPSSGTQTNVKAKRIVLIGAVIVICIILAKSCNNESTDDSNPGEKEKITTAIADERGAESIVSTAEAALDGFPQNEYFEVETESIEPETIEPEVIYASEEEYDSVRSAYNSAVIAYNTSARSFNSLLSCLSRSGFSDLPSKVSAHQLWSNDYFVYRQEDPDLQLFGTYVDSINEEAEELEKRTENLAAVSYNSLIDDYNVIAEAFNTLAQKTSLDYINGLPNRIELKAKVASSDKLFSGIEVVGEYSVSLRALVSEKERAISMYLLADQITSPSESWVLEKLAPIKAIEGFQAVTPDNDPNGLLGEEGGYSSCIYFSVDAAKSSEDSGKDIVTVGTDGGGAIEVYDSLEYALNRCDYLSQFDGTILYTGSYAIIGTMVVRTSYRLSNTEQIELTNEIFKSFTTVSVTGKRH